MDRSVTPLLPLGPDSRRQQLQGGCLYQSGLPSFLPVLLTSSNTPTSISGVWSGLFFSFFYTNKILGFFFYVLFSQEWRPSRCNDLYITLSDLNT